MDRVPWAKVTGYAAGWKLPTVARLKAILTVMQMLISFYMLSVDYLNVQKDQM